MPGLGEIEPDNVTEDPAVTEFGEIVSVILVGDRVWVVVRVLELDFVVIVVEVVVLDEEEEVKNSVMADAPASFEVREDSPQAVSRVFRNE